MKIIAKKSNVDYYDGIAKYGIDKQCVYVRKESEISIGEPGYENFFSPSIRMVQGMLPHCEINSYGRIFSEFNVGVAETMLILFCGRIYPAIRLYRAIPSEKKTYWAQSGYRELGVSYDYPDIEKSVREYADERTIKRFFSKERHRHQRSFCKSSVWRALTMSGRHFEDFHDVHHSFECPVIMWKRSPRDKEETVILNPNLGRLHFFKVVDPFTTFQEISSYIGGVLGGHSPKTVEISDQDRLEMHGFNERSFRKDPGQKKRKR